MKTADDFVEFLYGAGVVVVTHINHIEFDYLNFRFYFGWNSNISGWVLYRIDTQGEDNGLDCMD